MQKTDRTVSNAALLKKVKKSVYKQAILAVSVILLTLVLVFASVTAWYTNIAHTSGLVFEVEAWGFSGTVSAENLPIQAAPGDSGNVYLSLVNDSENVVEASVSISKANMVQEMQKRLFFYVETPMTRNDEIMERVYVNASESYTYTIFSKGNLNLSEGVHNDAQLKWEWVYDVLGYYVEGAMAEDGIMTIQEYLRPITYDYDDATTVFAVPEDSTTGVKELQSIDGVTVAEFLAEVSATDGYPGTITAETVPVNGYYPVSIDENGNGVWAYLCNYSEIETATIWDTQQGELAAQAAQDSTVQLPTYTARLSISAQKSALETTVVSTPAELQAALAAEGNAVLQLSQDLALGATDISEGKKAVLDLNGHELTAEGAYLFNALSGSSVTIMNGELAGGTDTTAVFANGAEVTFSGVTSEGFDRLVTLQDNYAGGADSKIRILDSNIQTTDCTVYLVGNGRASEQKTQLVVENSTLNSGYIAISGNGSDSGNGNWGTDTTIINSTVHGKWAGIYQPQQNSELTITGGSIITGNTAIALKGGHTVVIDSEVTGTGTGEEITEPAYAKSGFTDTGDGIYIEANYDWNISLEIYGSSKVSSDGAQAVRVFEENAPNASVTIYSGTFSTDVTQFTAEGASCTSDGTNYVVAAD